MISNWLHIYEEFIIDSSVKKVFAVPVFVPRSPGWEPGILSTRQYRIHTRHYIQRNVEFIKTFTTTNVHVGHLIRKFF